MTAWGWIASFGWVFWVKLAGLWFMAALGTSLLIAPLLAWANGAPPPDLRPWRRDRDDEDGRAP